MRGFGLAALAALLIATDASAQSVFDAIVPEAERTTQDLSTAELRGILAEPRREHGAQYERTHPGAFLSILCRLLTK